MDDCEEVLIKSSDVVAPAVPSRTARLLYLSSLDILWQDVPYNRRVLFYSLDCRDDDDDWQSLIHGLKRSLSLALVDFYPLAGRLVVGEDGRLAIDCNDMGVEFVEAGVDVCFADVEKGDFQPRALFNRLARWEEHPGCRKFDISLLSVQVTKFRSGGISLGYAHSHVVADGHSMWYFMNSWAACNRAVPISNHPLHTRTAFRVDNPLDEVANLPFELAVDTGESEAAAASPTGKLVERMFHFSAETIDKLKQTASEDEDGSKFSSFQVVCSHFWRRATIARKLSDREWIRFWVAANMRSKLTSPLPESYFGNAVLLTTADATAGELGCETLAATAARIQDAVLACNENALRGMVHWLELHSNSLGRALRFSSVSMAASGSTRFPVYGVNFGWGKPAAARTVKVRGDGEMVFFAGRDEAGSMDICISLSPESMDRLEKDSLLFAIF